MPEGLELDWNLVAAVIFGLFMLYFLSRVFYKPLKLLLRLLLWTVAGGVLIYFYNFAGAVWGLAVGLNVISAFIVGVMGLPGLGALIGLKYLFS
ncbi:MAG TPA: pro-sigmaK processing inhibitor BofA family protein [Bacillota bacterium]|jgi:inhibitor of the pro-sigma K processing machinery|nr:pro-sigmaK processing inhibitor BofA [Bacillota bacterium]HOA35981.1 pro-sigmaK processing inhibitor BofA family protein [Bacillota bacterium]HOJ84254.1 pro-sigmaK processing inhibitor BofA family protein [Bacillota bacterium]HOL16490.1 pro-sigmaK processing inhibitor BofA family protein [Bacillota bacterium]HPZ10723.1 pro-sigmaK processing inhibitor BofA family protein [Bacillota bacterium]